MVETHEEKEKLEKLKQKHKLELINAQSGLMQLEHKLKLERITKMLELVVIQKHPLVLRGD